MTETVIRSALADSSVPSYQREEVVKKGFPRGIKVFGILILSDCPNRVSKFIEMGHLEDAKLPFKTGLIFEYIGLPKEEANDFQERQWELIAPTFTRGTLRRQFEKKIFFSSSMRTRSVAVLLATCMKQLRTRHTNNWETSSL